MCRFIQLVLFSVAYTFVSAQDVPAFDIYLMYLGGNEDSGYIYSEPWNISNSKGYDNQPSFAGDGRSILFTSMRSGNQADIYQYQVPAGPLVQLTATAESEYSPEFLPGDEHFTVVRVEKDNAQRLWRFRQDGRKPRLLMRDMYDVGYYGRLADNDYALFVLPEPFTLQYVQVKNQRPLILDKEIGRSIKAVPGTDQFVYVSKKDSLEWMIKRYDIGDKKFEQITRIVPETEDLAWGPDNNLFMAHNAILCYFDYQKTNTWYQVADLSKWGLDHIYRLAFSPDGKWLAFVVAE
jgi:WD40 repeat protein